MVLDLFIRDKKAHFAPGAEIVLDNTDYAIRLTTDDEWNAYPVKTVVLVTSNGAKQEKLTTGNVAELDKLTSGTFAFVGVTAGDLRTTTPAFIPLCGSILGQHGTIQPPTEDVYDQIMEMLNGFSASVSKSGDTATITITDPSGTTTATVTDGQDGAPGTPGTPGAPGADGITPTIGQNGNWYLGDTDTGKPSRGEDGEDAHLPEATENGSALIWANGEWSAAPGYGYVTAEGTVITWDGSTAGKPSADIGEGIYLYKVADVPTRTTWPDALRGLRSDGSALSMVNVPGVTGGALYGGTDGDAVIFATSTTVEQQGMTFTFPETGVYTAAIAADGEYPAQINVPAQVTTIDRELLPNNALTVNVYPVVGGGYYSDRSGADIYAAYAAGNPVVCILGGGMIFPLLSASARGGAFGLPSIESGSVGVVGISIMDGIDGTNTTVDTTQHPFQSPEDDGLDTTDKTVVGAINELAARMPTIKTAMDAVAVPNAQYYLGQQAALSITMPTSAELGDQIVVVFSSGATACALTCDLTGFDFVPKANKTNKIVFTCISENTMTWIVETEES